MNILKSNVTNSIVIKKSKFITLLYRVETVQETKDILLKVRKDHIKASHICYAYIINNQKKYDDDDEPLNTAGKPILDVLEKNNMNYILAIVVRYFGGIKLGSNGLIRAYATSCSNLLNNNIKPIDYGYHIIINEDYNKEDLINYLCKDAIIISKEYSDKIIINVLIKKEILETFSNINFKIIKEIFF